MQQFSFWPRRHYHEEIDFWAPPISSKPISSPLHISPCASVVKMRIPVNPWDTICPIYHSIPSYPIYKLNSLSINQSSHNLLTKSLKILLFFYSFLLFTCRFQVETVAQARPRSCFRKSKPNVPRHKARLQIRLALASPTHLQSQSVGFSPFGSSATPFVCLLPLKEFSFVI
jgi:hypothetical protein